MKKVIINYYLRLAIISWMPAFHKNVINPNALEKNVITFN